MNTERTCGSCSACCRTHGIQAFKKRAGVWCRYCIEGKGCSIYSARPDECKDFHCAWLLGVGGAHYRPDIIGFVAEYRHWNGVGMMFWLWEAREGTLLSPLGKKWSMNNLLSGNCVLWLPLTGPRTMFLSEGLDSSKLQCRFNDESESPRGATVTCSFAEARIRLQQ
jgi:hypothetical protein